MSCQAIRRYAVLSGVFTPIAVPIYCSFYAMKLATGAAFVRRTSAEDPATEDSPVTFFALTIPRAGGQPGYRFKPDDVCANVMPSGISDMLVVEYYA